MLPVHTVHALLASLDGLAQKLEAEQQGRAAGAPPVPVPPHRLIIDSLAALLSPLLGERQHMHVSGWVCRTGVE